MKTTIEVNGFEIKIEELEGKIVVSAEKEGEVIEEFELESGEGTEGQHEGEEMMPFGEEEEDFGQSQEEEDDEEFDDDEEFGQSQEEEEEEESEGKLESFMSFMNKRKK